MRECSGLAIRLCLHSFWFGISMVRYSGGRNVTWCDNPGSGIGKKRRNWICNEVGPIETQKPPALHSGCHPPAPHPSLFPPPTARNAHCTYHALTLSPTCVALPTMRPLWCWAKTEVHVFYSHYQFCAFFCDCFSPLHFHPCSHFFSSFLSIFF